MDLLKIVATRKIGTIGDFKLTGVASTSGSSFMSSFTNFVPSESLNNNHYAVM